MSGPAHGTKTARKRAITRAIKEIADYLGNTPGGLPRLLHRPARVRRLPAAGSCSTAVHPDALEAEPGELPMHDPKVERAVLDLINEREAAPGVE